MANCTYTIRRPGNVAWAQGITSLADAADERERANRTCAPGHEIVAVWGNNETTDVSEDDVQDALAEREAIQAAPRY